MQRSILSWTVLSILSAVAVAPADALVTVSIEAPGATSTTITGFNFATDPLDSEPNGVPVVHFGGSSITGTTTGFINIGAANVYGGAGGIGSFGTVSADASIQLSGAVNYFGLWGSALDGQNSVELYSGNTLLGSYALQSILETSPGFTSAYRGNPLTGGNSAEDYAYFNFLSDTAFNRIRLVENGGGGFEFDNLTIGTVSAAPEPASWAMLLIGFGAIGCALRSAKRRTPTVRA
jgi:hypothetical protein